MRASAGPLGAPGWTTAGGAELTVILGIGFCAPLSNGLEAVGKLRSGRSEKYRSSPRYCLNDSGRRRRVGEDMADRIFDTGTDDISTEVTDGVMTITLNRPKRRNAMSNPMLQGLVGSLADAEVASDVGAVVLTGAGGAFCAGGDVKGMAEAGGEGGSSPQQYDARVHLQRRNQRDTAGKLYELPKPTLAALPGPAAGAGLSLALSCDLRYASPNAIMTTAFARVGFSGDYGGTYFMSRLIGSAKARELYFLSERVDMVEAERLGLVNGVFPEESLQDDVHAIAKRLAEGPTVAYRYMKENLNRAVSGEMGECLDMEATHHIHCGQTRDHREAAQAFVEKREPVFEGR